MKYEVTSRIKKLSIEYLNLSDANEEILDKIESLKKIKKEIEEFSASKSFGADKKKFQKETTKKLKELLPGKKNKKEPILKKIKKEIVQEKD